MLVYLNCMWGPYSHFKKALFFKKKSYCKCIICISKNNILREIEIEMGTMCHVVRKPCQIQQICKSRLNFQLHFYVENHLCCLWKIFLENKFQLENIFCSKPDHYLNLSSENTNILYLTFSFLFFFPFWTIYNKI